ncbi:MAG: 6,7-dimethyl-8-ribityllumazine synthase [Aureliella sp.]
MELSWNGRDEQRQIGVVVSTYNAAITDKLLEGALGTLTAAGVPRDQIQVLRVPGAWELPLATKWLAQSERVAAVISLGAVIRGETTHDQHINRAVSNALMELMQQSGKPIAFGLLTCNTLEQAQHRAGGDVGNKGEESAAAVLTMLALRDSITSP